MLSANKDDLTIIMTRLRCTVPHQGVNSKRYILLKKNAPVAFVITLEIKIYSLEFKLQKYILVPEIKLLNKSINATINVFILWYIFTTIRSISIISCVYAIIQIKLYCLQKVHP